MAVQSGNFKQVDLAYFAGVMDSDGWFTCGTTRGVRATGKKYGWSFVRLGVKQVTREAIDFITEKFGGRWILLKAGHNKKSKNPIYQWNMSKRDELRVVLPELIPHLKIKGRQAEIALEFYRDMVDLRHGQDPREIRRRELLVAEMKFENAYKKVV